MPARNRPSIALPHGARLALGDIDGAPHLIVSFPSRALRFGAGLTDAELSIAHLLLAGASNADIAHARGRSLPTIAKQVSSVFRKLGVSSRAELAARVVGRTESADVQDAGQVATELAPRAPGRR